MKHARPDYNRIQDPQGIIPHEEPVFLFRAQDKYGHLLVERYAEWLEADGVDPEMVQTVRDHAARMKAWAVRRRPICRRWGQRSPSTKRYCTREGLPVVSLTRIEDHFRVVATAPDSRNGPYDFPYNVELDGTYKHNHDYDLVEADARSAQ